MKKEIIILVDDNPTTIFYNKDVLMDLYEEKEVLSYEDPEIFLKNYLNGDFQDCSEIIVLLDINMPNYSGFEVLEEIEEADENNENNENDNLKVIMLTSSRLKSDQEKSERFTYIKGYIEKPLTDRKIMDCVGLQ